MKIGVDASRLTSTNRTGTENYLYYLLQEIARLGTPHEFILYFTNEPDPIFWQELTLRKSNFKYKVLKKSLSWTQVSLARELFKETPDILFSTWHTMPGINPFWKMKTIATIHDITGRVIPTYWTAAFASKLIAVSNSTKKDIKKKFGIRGKKISVIHEGFDETLFNSELSESVSSVKSKYHINGDYIFFLGSISDRKNIKNMVAAFNMLDTDVSFVLGGEALKGHEDLTELDAQFIGRVDQNDLVALYKGAKFFAFVSKEEGFGIPILEAMASGTPVITANTSSTKEVAGDAALLVDPDSVDDISKGMGRLLRDSELTLRLSGKGLAHVKSFSWEKAANETIKIFEKVHNEK